VDLDISFFFVSVAHDRIDLLFHLSLFTHHQFSVTSHHGSCEWIFRVISRSCESFWTSVGRSHLQLVSHEWTLISVQFLVHLLHSIRDWSCAVCIEFLSRFISQLSETRSERQERRSSRHLKENTILFCRFLSVDAFLTLIHFSFFKMKNE